MKMRIENYDVTFIVYSIVTRTEDGNGLNSGNNTGLMVPELVHTREQVHFARLLELYQSGTRNRESSSLGGATDGTGC